MPRLLNPLLWCVQGSAVKNRYRSPRTESVLTPEQVLRVLVDNNCKYNNITTCNSIFGVATMKYDESSSFCMNPFDVFKI